MDNLIYDGGVRLTAFIAVILVGGVLASRRSAYLIDYFMLIVCTNRLFRRVMDWADGAYDPQPLSSLAAPALGCMMVMVAMRRHRLLPQSVPRVGLYFAAALGYAVVLGSPNKAAALYALLNYLMPVGMLFYVLSLRVTPQLYNRWMRRLSSLGVFVAAYGIYQWAFMPPWDAAWVNWSEMWSSMGAPVAFKMSICSTLESRGPFSWFLATAAVPMCVDSRWRRPFGLPGLALVVFGIILSTARTALGFMVLSVLAFVIFSRGRNTSRLLVTCALVALVCAYALPQLPEHQRLIDRVNTISNLASDGSLQGRVDIATQGLWLILTRPLGYGLGATGVGADKLQGQAVSGDNGYIGLLVDFGIPGFCLLSAGMYRLLRRCLALQRVNPCPFHALPLGVLTGGLVFLIIGNWFSGPYGAIIMMLLGAGIKVQVEDRSSLPQQRCAAPVGRVGHMPGGP